MFIGCCCEVIMLEGGKPAGGMCNPPIWDCAINDGFKRPVEAVEVEAHGGSGKLILGDTPLLTALMLLIYCWIF